MNQLVTTAPQNSQIKNRAEFSQHDLMESWISYLDVKPETIKTYRKALKIFGNWMNEHHITEPTRTDLISFKEELIQQKRTASTIQTYFAAIKQYFKWTSYMGYYPNIADNLKGAKVRNDIHRKDPLTLDQAQELLASIDQSTETGLRDYCLIALALSTGLRSMSIVNANIKDLRNKPYGRILEYISKGHDTKDSEVKISPELDRKINEYLKLRGNPAGSEPLFTSTSKRNYGARMTTHGVRVMFKARLRNIGIDDERISFHSGTRHFAATQNLLNGGTLQETQQLLGHSSINTTMIYNHSLERANNDSELRLSALIL